MTKPRWRQRHQRSPAPAVPAKRAPWSAKRPRKVDCAKARAFGLLAAMLAKERFCNAITLLRRTRFWVARSRGAFGAVAARTRLGSAMLRPAWPVVDEAFGAVAFGVEASRLIRRSRMAAARFGSLRLIRAALRDAPPCGRANWRPCGLAMRGATLCGGAT